MGRCKKKRVNYYPFGLQQKRPNIPVNGRSHAYRYNNTELEEGLGLQWYEMPLRSFDPTIARWNRVDPVTHYTLSTYNTFANNPIYYADPSGGSHSTIKEGRWMSAREYTLDSNAGARVSYNWDTERYEDSNGEEVSYEEALASIANPNDFIRINTETLKAEIFADDNDYDTIETDGEISYSPKGNTRARLEAEGFLIRDIEGVGMGAFDNAVLMLSGEAAFAWVLRSLRGALAGLVAKGSKSIDDVSAKVLSKVEASGFWGAGSNVIRSVSRKGINKVDRLFPNRSAAMNWARNQLGHNTTKMYNNSGKLIGWKNKAGDSVYWGHGDWGKGLGSSTFPHLNYKIGSSKGHLFLEDKIINRGMLDAFKNYFGL